MKKKLMVIMLMLSLLTLVGCKKEEKEVEKFKVKEIYHYEESYQDTLYITYEEYENIKDIKLISKEGNEYKDSYENELDFIKEKVMLFYLGKEDYKNGNLKLEIETEKEKITYNLDLSKKIDYSSIEDLESKYKGES